MAVAEDAAVGDDGVIDGRPVDLGRRHEARARVNGGGHVEEIEAGQVGREVQVGLEEGADRPDILPVTLVNVGKDLQILDRLGNDVFAEIGQVVLQ